MMPITQEDIKEIISNYNPKQISIGSLASHSMLDIARGAKDEGFRTVATCKLGREQTYATYYKTRKRGNKTIGCIDEILRKFCLCMWREMFLSLSERVASPSDHHRVFVTFYGNKEKNLNSSPQHKIMRTLKNHVEKWYELSLIEVLKMIKTRGYATWMQVHDALQKHFTEFEDYYLKMYGIDPFSEEFVDKIFDEFYERVKKVPGMKVILLREEETPPDGEREIYGFGDINLIRRSYFYDQVRPQEEKKIN
ncbi:MAG: DUF1246 domain-containing protein [Candidatus Aenigmarchaeota archaeon]|nr:DUF1246 domain-containing protein [Candidatus Aenigmarchaeota archaeon]